jgi:hypothetical protein
MNLERKRQGFWNLAIKEKLFSLENRRRKSRDGKGE